MLGLLFVVQYLIKYQLEMRDYEGLALLNLQVKNA